jgi:uncharacterized protein involved in exopolysaccharide biosynthesis
MSKEFVTPRDHLDRLIGLSRRVLRYWWMIVLGLLVGVVVSFALIQVRRTVYQSSTVVLYREIIRSELLHGERILRDREEVAARLKEIVLARARLQDIIEELNLYPDVVATQGYVAAVEKMRNHVEFRSRGGDIFYIGFLGESPKVAFQVTQLLAETVIQEEERGRSEEIVTTKRFLDKELAAAQEELKNREVAMAQFLAKYPEFGKEMSLNQMLGGLIGGVGAAIRAQQSRPRRALPEDATLRRLQEQAEGLRRRIRQRITPWVDPQLRSEKERAEEALREARAGLADAESRFTNEHPDVRAAAAQVEAAERRLQRADKALRTTAPASQDTGDLEAELADINQQIEKRQAQLRREDGSGKTLASTATSIVDLETDWTRLNREMAEARERYDLIEAKHFRASIEANSQLAEQSTHMSIIDPAYLPTREAGAGKKVIALAGLLLCGGLGFAVALGLALFDDRFYNRRDVERLELLPVLTVVPKDKRPRRKRR